GNSRQQVRAQPGDAGAVANQNEGPLRLGRVKLGIAADAQANPSTRRRVVGEPAGAEAEVLMVFVLPYQQVQRALRRRGGNGVFPVRQLRQAAQQVLGRQVAQPGQRLVLLRQVLVFDRR